MAKVLTENVYMVDHETSKPHFLLKGQQVPKWAADRLDDSQTEDVKAKSAKSTEGDAPSEYDAKTVAELDALIKEREVQVAANATKPDKVAALVAHDSK